MNAANRIKDEIQFLSRILTVMFPKILIQNINVIILGTEEFKEKMFFLL